MMVSLLFIIGHMGLFFYNKIGSIIPAVDLPTTEIIEPFFVALYFTIYQLKNRQKRVTMVIGKLVTDTIKDDLESGGNHVFF